jgi:hypothetical protein
VLVVVVLEPLDLRPVARVADEAEALGERRRPEELGVGLHRVALETQQPHMMQSASLWIGFISSCEWMNSFSGISS